MKHICTLHRGFHIFGNFQKNIKQRKEILSHHIHIKCGLSEKEIP